MSFEDAIVSVRRALERHDFRVLTEIDMNDNFKKANLDFRPYLIVGACNLQLTYRALQAEDKIGTIPITMQPSLDVRQTKARTCRL